MKKLAIIGFIVSAFALPVAAQAKQVADPGPIAPSAQIRSQSVNVPFGHSGIALHTTGVRVTTSQAHPQPSKPTGMSAAEYRALMLRSEALNQRYGLDVPVKGENYYARGGLGPVDTGTPPAASSSTDFQWGDFGIGVSGVLALVALTAAMVIGLRRHRGHLRTS